MLRASRRMTALNKSDVSEHRGRSDCVGGEICNMEPGRVTEARSRKTF